MSDYTGYNMPPGVSNVDIPGFIDDRMRLEIDYGRPSEPISTFIDPVKYPLMAAWKARKEAVNA